MSEFERNIVRIIATLCSVPAEEIRGSDRLREDLGMDSITSMELVSVLAEELDLEIEVEEAIGVGTVDEVFAMARARASGAAAHVAVKA